ncbi:hypothetical protein FE783_30320 [Paenibacillus mesophilus]|uniref:hypothetical protein n=1 Tax=Paenibacillus mesophilus TaxID=2582849 RepID=UPI00110E43E7|nr:hypothetical protein [Paenibacillus mesophilus]TMV45155.1 hypothetical protein FE783_30320 [Paenibacillus mesophilus]
MTNPNPHLNVTKPYEEFNQAVIRLGFMPSESEGYKVVQLTFSSTARNDKIMYRIPFVSDGSERITLLVHQAGFSGEWAGCDGIPEQIREEAHRKLCELVGVPYEPRGADREPPADKDNDSQSDTVNGIMVQDEQDLVRLGKEMKAMKTNTELEQEGMIPDPIQN